MGDFGSASAPMNPAGPAESGPSSGGGLAGISASSYNSMAGMNHMRFECGVDLGALLKTDRKRLFKALWAAPDSPDAMSIGYMSMTPAH
jgi:hypothetical protein